MVIRQVEAYYGRTIQLSDGDWFKMSFGLVADVEEGEDPEEVKEALKNQCKAMVITEYLELTQKKAAMIEAHRAKLSNATPMKAG